MTDTTARLIDALTIAEKDKEEALPLIRRFYNLGFNIEATHGTALFLREHGIRKLYAVLVLDDISANLRCGGRPLPYK